MDVLSFLPWLWYHATGPGAAETMLIGGNTTITARLGARHGPPAESLGPLTVLSDSERGNSSNDMSSSALSHGA